MNNDEEGKRRKILSNIPTVSGTRAARAQEAAEADEDIKKRQMMIAREMAREDFEKALPYLRRNELTDTRIRSDAEFAAEEAARIKLLMEQRARRTLQMISQPNNNQVYNTYEERAYFTDHMTDEIMKDMKIKLSAESSTVASVAKSLRLNLKAALFGCDVHVGVCIDANASELIFVGENDYTRREQRSNSTVFECLDRRDIVVQALQRPRTPAARKGLFSRGSLQNGAADDSDSHSKEKEAAITSGEAVVYVPLLGKRGGVGVLEIHGLFSDEITDPKRYERRTAALHGMILKQDYRFIHTLRLWRKPGTRLEYASEEQRMKFSRSDYHLVCGRITEVVHTRNGVPFVGGAHYAVAWEDGWVEEAVSAAEILKIYAMTPASLGTNSTLDIKLITDLLNLGKAAGVLVEKQRTKDALMLLQKKLYVPSLGEIDTFERTLDIALANVRGIKRASLVVWDALEHEAIELCTLTNPGTLPAVKSLTDVTKVSVNSATPFIPEIVGEPGADLLEWVVMEMEVPEGYQWRNNVVQKRFFALMTRLRILSGKAADAETQIFADILRTLSKAIRVKWERDERTKHRKELIRVTEGKLFEWKSMPMQDICQNTTLVAASVLPGAHVYTGVLMPGADCLQFLAASSGSQMIDKVLRRPHGVSFSVTENLETVIINSGDDKKSKYLQEGALCEVYYGRKAFAGKIYKVRGHDKYDVEYLELQSYRVEAGVDVSRIVPMHTAFRMKHLGGPFQTPYVCVPLRHRDKGLGVIAMDTIADVPRAPYDAQPEYGLQKFLEQLGRILGTTIDLQRRKMSLKELTVVSQNVNSEIMDVLEATRKAITDNMYFAESVQVCRVYYTTQEILSRGGPGIEVLLEWGKKDEDAVKRMASFHATRSNQKPVQQHGDKNAWLLLKLRGMTRVSKGKIYIISITQRIVPVTEPDLEFLSVLHKVLKSSMQSIDLKEEAGDGKTKALREIKNVCADWRTMSRDALFAAVADHVNSIYLSANIYVGRMNAHGKELQFFLASSRSRMAGKRLLRDPHKPPRVSITALDDVERCVVLPSMKLSNDLHHFGPPESFEYPFVAVPLVAHVDAPVGVLCGDACEDPSAGDEDTGEVLAFFGAVGMHLSEPVRGYSQQDATSQLKQIAQNFPTVRQGMREVKRVLLSIVPNALRVAEVEFEPRELRTMSTNDIVGADTVAVTKDDYVVLLRVLSAKMLSDASSIIKSPVVTIKWMGQESYKCGVKRRMDTRPLMLSIPRGAPLSSLQCQIVLQGAHGGTVKEISRKTLGLQYLSNAPLTTVDHILDSSSSDTVVHVAKLSLSSKMFYSSQAVSIRLSTISIRGLAKADDYGLADPFVILFWNGEELTQTSVQKNNLDPTWTDLGIELRLDGKSPEECHLAMDVWDQDFLGRGDFLGRVELSGTDLNTLFVLGDDAMPTEDNPHPITSHTYISLGKHPTLADEAQELVQGRVKLAGDAILAKDLTSKQMDAELDVIGKLEKDSAFEEEDEANAFAAFHECEIQILSARGLSLGEDAVRYPSTFGVIKFNGEEVGRTSVVEEAASPIWEEEKFGIRCPGGDKLEDMVLSIDIMHAGLNDEGKAALASDENKDSTSVEIDPFVRSGGPLGRVEITGKALVGLVAATHFQSRWLDIGPPLKVNGGKTKKGGDKKGKHSSNAADISSAEGYGGRGEILLGGRPINTIVDVPAPIEAPILEIVVFGVRPFQSNDRKFNRASVAEAVGRVIKYDIRVLFNGKQVHRTGAVTEDQEWRKKRYLAQVLGDAEDEGTKEEGIGETKETEVGLGFESENTSMRLVKGGDAKQYLNLVSLPISWDDSKNCRAILRVPNDRSLSNCVMEIQLWRSIDGVSSDEEALVEKIGQVRFEGDALVDVSGQSNSQTRRFYTLEMASAYMATNQAMGLPDDDLIQEVWLQSGIQGNGVQFDNDGREIFVDVACARCLPHRSERAFVEVFGYPPHAFDKYQKCQVSPVVEVRWNGDLLGRSKPVRNTSNAEWSECRFKIAPPSIEGVVESLYYCHLELSLYDVGPGYRMSSAYAESRTDSMSKKGEEEGRVRQLVGRVILEKDDLVAFLGGPTYASSQPCLSRWFPLHGPPVGSPERTMFSQVDINKARPYGELKLHALRAPSSTLMPTTLSKGNANASSVAGAGLGREIGRYKPLDFPEDYHEIIVQAVEASGLAKPDAFSASNPYVVIELDGREVYRSDELKDTSDPRFLAEHGDAMKCILRFRTLADILKCYQHMLPEHAPHSHEREMREKAIKALSDEEREWLSLSMDSSGAGASKRSLVFSVWNHNTIASQRDEFLGCHTINGEANILAYFRKPHSDVGEGGSVTDTFWLEKSDEMTPDENEFAQGQLTVKAFLASKPSADVIITRPAILWIKKMKDLFNTKSFGSGSDVFVKVFRSWILEGDKDELVYETKAIASSCEPEFTDELATVLVPRSEQVQDWAGLSVRLEAWDVTTNDFFGCVVMDGHALFQRLHAPESASFESTEIALSVLPSHLRESVRAPNGGNVDVVGDDKRPVGSIEIAGGWKEYYDAHYKPQKTTIPSSEVGRNVNNSNDTSNPEQTAGLESESADELADGQGSTEGRRGEVIDESGEACEIHILRATDIPKADGMLGKSDPFCIVRWNYREVGRTAVIPKDLNPVWDDERFQVNLAAAKDPNPNVSSATSSLSEAREETKSGTPTTSISTYVTKDISLESILDIDVWDQDTVGAGDFLGKIRLTGKDLALLLDPDTGEREYPLTPSDELTPRGNKLATKGTITLEGHIVSLQRERAIRRKKEEEARRREIEANPGLQSSKVELHILKANNLSKVSMRGAADAFFEVYWLEGKEDLLSDVPSETMKAKKGKIDDKSKKGAPSAVTQVVKGTLNPEFDNEILTLVKPAGIRISDTNMRLVCYHRGATGNQYMGEASIAGAEIVAALPRPMRVGDSEAPEPKPVTLDLEAFEGATVIQTKYVGGTVTFSLRQIGEDSNINATFAPGKSKFIPRGMKEMQITVLAASNLAKANTFGASDPYCIVKWAGREIGRTATIQETCNPVWGETKPETFSFLAPDDLGLPIHIKEAANIAAEEKKFKKLQKQLMMEGKDHSDAVVEAILEERRKVDNTAPPKDLLLSIDCYDWNALNSGIFLGSVELRGDELNEFAAGGRHKVNWFDLKRTRRLRNSEQGLVVTEFRTSEERDSRARLELMMGPSESVSTGGKVAVSKGNQGARVHVDEGETRLDIEVCAARGLAKADTFGSADPYVKVYWNNVKIGATSVISNNQSPVWEDEKFYGSFFTPLELEDCSLYLEVWDRDIAGDGDFLGCVQLNGQKLRDVVDKTRYHPNWYPLVHSKMLPGAVQDLVQGELEIRIGDNAKMALIMENAQRFELEVISAKNLARADGMFGLSDPYAIVKWNYTELGRTSYVSKTLNPVWDTSNTFALICSIDDNEDESNGADTIGQLNHLQVDVWDYDMVGNGKFLGCAIITGKDLDNMFKPSVLMDEDKTTTFGLALDPRRENQEGGITPKGTIEMKLRIPNESSGSLAQALNLKWDSERDVAAGTPTIEIDILKVNSLPITKVLQRKCNPMVVIEWEHEEIGATDAGNSCDYEWKDSKAHFTLKIPIHAEVNNSQLKLMVFDSDSLRRGDFLGQVTLPFRGILRMQHGRFTMPLLTSEKYKNSYVRGNITFDLSFAYPYWDAVCPHSPTKILRKITVISAKNLPGINEQTPTTKGVIQVEGLIKAKTQLSVKTSAPEWAPANCVTVVDMNKPIDVSILVYHVDLTAKKEFAIGQYDVPFELLVRPPKAAFDVPLTPPSKLPPKKYRFQVGGQVRISLTADNTVVDALRPFAFHHKKPDAALIVRDVCPVTGTKKSKQDLLYDGETLGREELLWMGTAIDLSRVTTLPTRPEWMIVPLHDPSQRVGYRAVDMIGTIPGRRLALAVQRPADRHNVSDAVMIEGIWREVDHCISQLRRKEIYRELRMRALEKFDVFLQGITDKEDFDVHEVEKYIFDAIQTCCPGVRVYIGRVSPDFEHIRYILWDSSGESRPFSIFKGMGSEWEFTGRHPPASHLVKKFSDFSTRQINTYTPFPTTSFPRIVAPLAAGDVSLGFFGIENLDIQRARLEDSLTDEREMASWLQEMGRLCGESIYTGREKKALREMESYALSSGSTRTGVVVEILRACMNVLQGCKLMEVWSIDPNNHIQSLASQQPMSMPLPGRKVTVSTLNIRVLGGKGLLGLVDDPTEQVEETTPDAAALNDNVSGEATDDRPDSRGEIEANGSSRGADADLKAVPASTDNATLREFNFLIGLRYDNVEQLHPVTINEKETKISVPIDRNFMLTFDRSIYVTLYLVDKGLRTLRDWYGKVNFTTFEETSLKTSLNRHKSVIPAYDVSLSLKWPSAGENQGIENASAVDLKLLKSFNVNIKSARDLMGADGDTSDPFCEVHYCGKFIGKTKHVDKTLDPVFNERFAVPFTGEKGSLTVDIFDMSMVGKGAFLGQVEIPFDLLLTPPPGEFEYPLRMKKEIAARKQKYVGGMLTIEYDFELRKEESQVDAKAAKEAKNSLDQIEIPQTVWAMKTPSISLTVHSALNLAKANLFGGTSDPFVVIFLDFHGSKKKTGSSEEPIFKTKVIDNNLSPEWDETFTINLGVHMQQGATTAKDFPTIRLEVYDYNSLMKGEFLGCCEIGPTIYFSMKHGEFQLGPSPKLNSRQNRLAQGELSLTFILQDNMANSRTSDFTRGKYGTLEGMPCVEIHVLRARGLMVAKRLSGRSDPYVVVRWNGKDRGETTTKKGTLDPAWNNESFLVNLAEAKFQLPDLHIEVWDRDFFTGGQFMGEVVVPGEILLHPPDSNAIEEPLKPRDGEKDSKVTGMLSYKLVSRYRRQALSFPPKEYVEVKASNTASFSPMDVKVARDPDEEEKRQKFEKVSLPSLVNKAKQDTLKYVNEPFSRSGVISEVHYGQIMSAINRNEHTILKIEGKADIVCIPASSDEASSSKNGEAADKAKSKNKTGKGPSTGLSSSRREKDSLYMVARYDHNQTPRRDMKFLVKFQSILVRGLQVATNRKDRIAKRDALVANMEYILENTKAMANDVIVHGLVEVESGISATCDMFALLPDGKTFAACSKSQGDPDISSDKANDFIILAARLCRHGFMLQYFRGQMLLCDWSWLNTSQLAMVSLESIAEQIDDAEGEGYVHILLDVAKSYAPDGGWLVPLIGENESMMAMLYVKDLDKLPYAAYRIRRLEDETKRKKLNADKAAGKTSSKRKKDYIECFGPEDGVAHALRETGKGLGIALLKARMGDAVRKMRTFPITHETTLVDILRNAFRVLVVAVPTIRGVSIWGIDMAREPKIKRPKSKRRQLNFIEQLKRMLGMLVFDDDDSVADGDGNHDDDNDDENDDAYKQSSKEDRLGFPEVCCGYFGSESPDNLLHTHLQIMKGEVRVIEKKTFADISEADLMAGKKLEVKIEKQKIVSGARRSSAITDQHMLAKRKRMLQSMEKKLVENDVVPSIDWTLGIPFSLQQTDKKEEDSSDSEDSDNDDDDDNDADVSHDTFQKAKKEARLKKKEEKRRKKEMELSERGKTRDCSYATTLDVQDTAKIYPDAMAVVHAECKRCTESLDKQAFRVATGNILSWVGRSEDTIAQFNDIFGMKAPSTENAKEETGEAEDQDKGQGGDQNKDEGAKNDGVSVTEVSSEPTGDMKATSLGALGELAEGDEEEEDSASSAASSPRSILVSPRPAGMGNAPALTTAREKEKHGERHAKSKPSAPLPPGKAPVAFGLDGNDLLADLDDDTLVSAEVAAKAALERKKKEKDKSHIPRLRYFISVNSHGIGGEYGYGTLGDQFVDLLSGLGEEIDEGIKRIFKAKEKKRKEDEEAERRRLEEEEARRKQEEEEEKERQRKAEEKRKRKELNARLRGESGSDSDSSTGSAGSRGGRRGSVAGRRGSVSGRRASVSGRRASVSTKSKK